MTFTSAKYCTPFRAVGWHDRVPSRSIGPAAHTVVLPNYQEDEATLREPSENLVRSFSVERRVITVLAMEAFVKTEVKAAEDHLSSTWCC